MAAIPVATVLSALKTLSTLDVPGLIKALEGKDFQSKVVDGLAATDDILQVAGLFFPPAAIAANDLQVALEIEKIAGPALIWLAKQPSPSMVGKISVWGSVLDDPNYDAPSTRDVHIHASGPDLSIGSVTSGIENVFKTL